jgi:hypothetical protein
VDCSTAPVAKKVLGDRDGVIHVHQIPARPGTSWLSAKGEGHLSDHSLVAHQVVHGTLGRD